VAAPSNPLEAKNGQLYLSRFQWVGSAAILCLAVVVAGCTTPTSNAKLASSASAELAEGSQASADMMARCKRHYGMWHATSRPIS
jgi:hypothetical protein